MYRRIKRLQAPASCNNDTANAHQRIRLIPMICQTKCGDKASLTQLREGRTIPQTEGVGEVADRCSGDSLQLFGRLVDLDLPILALVFLYAVMIPGVAADDIAGGV